MKSYRIRIVFPVLLLLALLLPLLSLTASAEEGRWNTSSYPRLLDFADLLSDEQEAELLSLLDGKSAEQEFDFVIASVPSLDGADILTYADELYDGFGFGDDGMLFLLAMEEREWAFSACGFGITVFSDSDTDYIAEQMLPDLSRGNYAEAFCIYVDQVDAFLTYARTYGSNFSENGYDSYEPYFYDDSPQPVPPPFGKRLLFSAVIGLVIGLIVVGGMSSKMKAIRANNSATDYMSRSSLNLTRSNDTFLYSSVSKIRRNTETRSGSGSSHHGGGSVRSSSSGRSHSGSHGHF